MNRTKYILTNNKAYLAADRLRPTGIVVHSTGCNQKNIGAYRWQFDTPSIKASVHGCLGMDNGKLTFEQWLPFNIQCWGCGSGVNGSFNGTHLQFEIAEDVNDREWTMATYEAALEICAEWVKKYHIPIENVVDHSEAHKLGYGSNHGDVTHWWSRYGLSMGGFRAELRRRVDDYMTKEQILTELGDQWIERFDDLPEWAKPDMRQLLDEQVINGGTAYNVDPDDINMFLSDIKAIIMCKRMMK